MRAVPERVGRRLIGLGQPGSPASLGRSGATPWPGTAGSLGAAQGRELRPAWYVTFGATAVVLVGAAATPSQSFSPPAP